VSTLNSDIPREEDKRMEELMEIDYAKFEESVLVADLPLRTSLTTTGHAMDG